MPQECFSNWNVRIRRWGACKNADSDSLGLWGAVESALLINMLLGLRLLVQGLHSVRLQRCQVHTVRLPSSDDPVEIQGISITEPGQLRFLTIEIIDAKLTRNIYNFIEKESILSFIICITSNSPLPHINKNLSFRILCLLWRLGILGPSLPHTCLYPNSHNYFL